MRHDEAARSWSSAAPRACSTRSVSVTTTAGGRSVPPCRSTDPIDVKALPPGIHLQDALLMGLYDPGPGMAMANTAEELGRRYEITRERLKATSSVLRSHTQRQAGPRRGLVRRGDRAGLGAGSTVASRTGRGGKYDTHILEDVSLEKMARLRPAFEPGGVITAGNASAVVDGAAAMVIGKESDVEKHGLKPLARIAGIGVAACDPQIMGWGPVPAVRQGPRARRHERAKTSTSWS